MFIVTHTVLLQCIGKLNVSSSQAGQLTTPSFLYYKDTHIDRQIDRKTPGKIIDSRDTVGRKTKDSGGRGTFYHFYKVKPEINKYTITG